MKMNKAIGAGLLAIVAAASAGARTLHWRSIEVKARLDGNGLLHVSERQNMVFDGEWNGGERKFRIEPGQELKLAGMSRIDPDSGERAALSEGSLSSVDRYEFV